MKSRLKTPDSIAAILKSALSHLKLEEPLEQYQFILQWPEIVGETIAKQANPVKVQDGTLIIEVNHPAWIQELNFLKNTFLKKIESFYPESKVKSIRFVLK